jgi:hypothetical protein
MVGVRMLQSCYLIVKGLFATPPERVPEVNAPLAQAMTS